MVIRDISIEVKTDTVLSVSDSDLITKCKLQDLGTDFLQLPSAVMYIYDSTIGTGKNVLINPGSTGFTFPSLACELCARSW